MCAAVILSSHSACVLVALVKRPGGAAHTSPMDETGGTISLDTLKQSAYSVDRCGNQHALTDTKQSYLENTLAHLRKMGHTLYSLVLRRRGRDVQLAEMTGWENGVDVSVAPRGEAAASEWLEGTALVSAIRSLLGDTGQQDHQ
jgi:hypothetical protein